MNIPSELQNAAQSLRTLGASDDQIRQWFADLDEVRDEFLQLFASE